MAIPENPINREETYLANIAGQEVPLPTTPITRKEAYLAGIAGENVEVPEIPITREEAYLDAILKGGGGGGGSTLISKNITANGTYKAQDDNADGYSEVSVAVSPNTGTKNITDNGIYNAASDGLDGYSSVEVDVSGGGTVFYLDNGKIATSAGEYIMVDLLQELSANTLLLFAMKDGTKKINDIIFYTGGTQAFSIDGGAYELTITPTTIGLTYYGGDYRNIYAKLSGLDPSQVY